jgi:hypothetical protein
VSQHLSTLQIGHFRERVLSPAELLAAGDHLADCEPCRSVLDYPERLRAMVASLRAELWAEAFGPSDHLSHEQIADHVDGCANEVDREIVESHLDACSQCLTEIQHLIVFRAEISARLDKEYCPERLVPIPKKLTASSN